MRVVRTSIVVTLEKAGLHCWPDNPHDHTAYLKNPHRHLFKITCKKAVTDDNRQIEFIAMKEQIAKYVDLLFGDGDLGSSSCEMLARKIYQQFDLNYCCVMEDGENGAVIEQW